MNFAIFVLVLMRRVVRDYWWNFLFCIPFFILDISWGVMLLQCVGFLLVGLWINYSIHELGHIVLIKLFCSPVRILYWLDEKVGSLTYECDLRPIQKMCIGCVGSFVNFAFLLIMTSLYNTIQYWGVLVIAIPALYVGIKSILPGTADYQMIKESLRT